MVYTYLLCQVYKEGYYIKIDDDFDYMVSADLNMNYEKIGQIINFLVKRSLFDEKLFNSDNVLTSVGIQRRFQKAVQERAKKTAITVNERFWLLSKDETETFIKVRLNGDFFEKNCCKSENNDIKESKVNKSKEKESKEIPSADADTQSHFDFQKIVNLFNSICVSLPKVREISDNRKKQIKNADKKLNSDFKSFFERIEKSDFLTGSNGKWYGGSFDWVDFKFNQNH